MNSISWMLSLLATAASDSFASSSATGLASTFGAPRNPCSSFADFSRPINALASLTLSGAGACTTSPNSSTVTPPKPTIMIGPKVASLIMPMTSSKPFGAIFCTSTPSMRASGLCFFTEERIPS